MMSEYNVGYLVGCIAGVVCGIILVVLLLRFMNKDGSVKCKFDERQELIRGKGYKFGFHTFVVFMALDICFGEMLEMYADRMVISMTGLCLGILVYAVYAIWNEGYIALNENPKRVMITFALLSVLNIAIAVSSMLHGELLVDGRISFRMMNMICGITLLLIVIVIFAKSICTRSEDAR